MSLSPPGNETAESFSLPSSQESLCSPQRGQSCSSNPVTRVIVPVIFAPLRAKTVPIVLFILQVSEIVWVILSYGYCPFVGPLGDLLDHRACLSVVKMDSFLYLLMKVSL